MNIRSKPFTLTALLALAVVLPLPAMSATVRVKSGSFEFLKQEKQVNLEFDYSNMKVGLKPQECIPEKEFVAQLNAKRSGHGDLWRNEWLGNLSHYQGKFQGLLNKQLAGAKPPLVLGAFKDAKYTLILKTTTVLTGREGFMATAPFISADAVFVETKNRTNTMAAVELERMPGVGAWATYMSEAYAKAGKDLGNKLRSKAR